MYEHGVRTVHDYVEDYDAGHTTQMAMGMTATDFDMDVYVTTVANEHRHTEGDIDGEVVGGWRNGATVVDVAFALHDAGVGDFAFNSHSHTWFIVNPYEIEHTPVRTTNGPRLSTNQDYRVYYQVSGSDAVTSLTSASFPQINSSSASNTLVITTLGSATGRNTGQLQQARQSWGSNTDNAGTTTTYNQQDNGVGYQVGADYPLGLTDQHQPLPILGGYGDGWQVIEGLQSTPGFDANAVSAVWVSGLSAAGNGTGSSSGSNNATVPTTLNEGWTQATNPHDGKTGQYWYVYTETGPEPHDWQIDYYSGPPQQGGQFQWSEHGEPPTPFGGWGEGEGGAQTDTGVTPADEADGEVPNAAHAREDEGDGTLLGIEPGEHSNVNKDSALNRAQEHLKEKGVEPSSEVMDPISEPATPASVPWGVPGGPPGISSMLAAAVVGGSFNPWSWIFGESPKPPENAVAFNPQIHPKELQGFTGSIEDLGGMYALYDSQGRFIGIYDPEDKAVFWSDGNHEYRIGIEEIVDTAKNPAFSKVIWEELFKNVGQKLEVAKPEPPKPNGRPDIEKILGEGDLRPGQLPTHLWQADQATMLPIGQGFTHLGEIIVAGQPSPSPRSPSRSPRGAVNAVDDVGGPLHHIATNKNHTSPLRGGPWSPRFEKIFKRAGMNLDDALNKVRVPGHKGPHPEAYHNIILKRLQAATDGLSGAAYAGALRRELRRLAAQLRTPGSVLNRYVTGLIGG